MATVYQHSTLAALMAGLLGGTTTVGELLTHGNTGIGTMHGVDGEVILLDGQVYQATADGQVHHITDQTATLPFATVHQENEAATPITVHDATMQTMTMIDDQHLQNNFSSIVLHGVFKRVQVRVAPKATEPFPSLLDLTEQQPVFEQAQVAGTLVGYYSPALYHGVVAAGWHIHFLSDDRQFAGHVLAFEAQNLVGTLTAFSDYQLHLPIDNADFRQHELDMTNLSAGITAAEGGAE